MFKTIPIFLESNPGFRISLLNFDVDLYEATKFGLEKLFDKVVSGGVVIFDEYALQPWEGETQAVEEFLLAKGLKYTLRKLPFSSSPGAYLIK